MMRSRTPILLSLAVLALAAPISGCSNIWRESFRPIAPAPSLAGSTRVELREIPWDRMEMAIEESQRRLVKSDVHPSEWSDEQRLDARTELLRNLQVSADPGAVGVVGVSSFRTTDNIKPWDGTLESFARDAGANMVVWSDRYLGKADAIVDYTVHGYGTGHRSRRDATEEDRASWRSDSYTVPLVVAKDERGFTAFYLRVSE